MLYSQKWLLIGILTILTVGIIGAGAFYTRRKPTPVAEKPEKVIEEPKKEEILEKPISSEKIPQGQKEIPDVISTFIETNKVGVVEILLPYDFENDGRQEFLVGERIPGSAAVLYWYVLFEENGVIQKIEPPHGYKEVKMGRYRGNNWVTITNEGLIKEIAPLYLENDPNCCPSGGQTLFFFQFKNGKLELIKTEFQESKNL